MTTAPRVPCLATTLLQKPTPRSVQIVRRYRVPLEGAELREYEEKRKEQEASVAKEESESESDEEDAEEDDGMARPGGAVGQATAMFKRGLKLTPSFPMYGFKEVNHIAWPFRSRGVGRLINPACRLFALATFTARLSISANTPHRRPTPMGYLRTQAAPLNRRPLC